MITAINAKPDSGKSHATITNDIDVLLRVDPWNMEEIVARLRFSEKNPKNCSKPEKSVGTSKSTRSLPIREKSIGAFNIATNMSAGNRMKYVSFSSPGQNSMLGNWYL